MTPGCGFFYNQLKTMKPGLNIVSLWFGVIMVTLVTAGAVAITFTDFMSDRLYGTKRIMFVIMLLAYAVYRSFRIYQLMKYTETKKSYETKEF